MMTMITVTQLQNHADTIKAIKEEVEQQICPITLSFDEVVECIHGGADRWPRRKTESDVSYVKRLSLYCLRTWITTRLVKQIKDNTATAASALDTLTRAYSRIVFKRCGPIDEGTLIEILWQTINTWDSKSSQFSTWLSLSSFYFMQHRLDKQKRIDEYETHNITGMGDFEEESYDSIVIAAPARIQPEEQVLLQEQRDKAHQVLSRLPARQREALLRHAEGQTVNTNLLRSAKMSARAIAFQMARKLI